jgi:integrase
VLGDRRAAGRADVRSLMELDLETWARELAKAALRRGRPRSSLKPPLWGLRTCHRLLLIAYDPREWWEHTVWDPRVDPRIPIRSLEPPGRPTANFGLVSVPWLRLAAQWHGKVGMETGALRFGSVRDRITALTHLARFLEARGVDHPALADRPQDLRLLALDFLSYLRTLRSQTGHNRGQPLSDSHVTHVMGNVEQFYAWMADHHHEAADRLADHRWRLLGDEHARLWRVGEKPTKPTAPREERYLDDTAMSRVMAQVHRLGDPADEGGMGDEQAMRILMLLALTGRRVSELLLLEFEPLLPIEGLVSTDDDDGAIAKLRYGQTKIDGAPDTILVDADVVAVIHAQQEWALARFRERSSDREAKPRHLFLAATRNRHGERPYPAGSLSKKLRRFSELIAVTDSQGRPVTLSQTHRFRHTKATTLINAGVPLHVVQRYLGHLSPSMTMHYARTLQATHEREFLRFKKVTADGRDLELDPRDLYELIELDQRTDRILPNGVCLLPPRQVCDRGNACLTCDKFATDASHLADHERQLGRLVDLIDDRGRAFQRKTGREMSEDNVWLEQRRREQRALERIIGALDRAELRDTEANVRGAGVDARLADDTAMGG